MSIILSMHGKILSTTSLDKFRYLYIPSMNICNKEGLSVVSQIFSRYLTYLLDDLENLAMVGFCDDHLVNVFLAFDVDWSERSQFRGWHSLLPSLGLIVLDA